MNFNFTFIFVAFNLKILKMRFEKPQIIVKIFLSAFFFLVDSEYIADHYEELLRICQDELYSKCWQCFYCDLVEDIATSSELAVYNNEWGSYY